MLLKNDGCFFPLQFERAFTTIWNVEHHSLVANQQCLLWFFTKRLLPAREHQRWFSRFYWTNVNNTAVPKPQRRGLTAKDTKGIDQLKQSKGTEKEDNNFPYCPGAGAKKNNSHTVDEMQQRRHEIVEETHGDRKKRAIHVHPCPKSVRAKAKETSTNFQWRTRTSKKRLCSLNPVVSGLVSRNERSQWKKI